MKTHCVFLQFYRFRSVVHFELAFLLRCEVGAPLHLFFGDFLVEGLPPRVECGATRVLPGTHQREELRPQCPEVAQAVSCCFAPPQPGEGG